jgi:hypothetical protein
LRSYLSSSALTRKSGCLRSSAWAGGRCRG